MSERAEIKRNEFDRRPCIAMHAALAERVPMRIGYLGWSSSGRGHDGGRRELGLLQAGWTRLGC